MTYVIGIFNEVHWARYLNENLNSVEIDAGPDGLNQFGEESPLWVDLINSGIPIRPVRASEFHTVWDGPNNTWTVDQSTFTPVLKDTLKNHRAEVSQGIVEYDGLFCNNDAENRNLVVSIIVLLEAKNDPDYPINWKGPPDPNDPAQENRWKECYLEDFHGIMLTGGLKVQKAFTAEKYILDQHETTPYEFISDAVTDFDTYFENL